MKEEFTQPIDQERNLALERAEAVKLHNETLAEYNQIPEEDKEWNSQTNSTNNPEAVKKQQEMRALRKNVENIDKYKEIAKPQESQEYVVGDTSQFEKLKDEKEKIDTEVEKTKKEIESTTIKLNELRASLGLPETDMIPSLMVKKEKLSSLIAIQSDLENKLNDESLKNISKETEKNDDSKLEMYNLKASLEEVVSNLRPLLGELRDREGMGMNQVFDNENLIGSAMQNLESLNDKKDLPEYLNKLSAGFNIDYRGRGRFSENTDSLRKMEYQLNRLYSSIEVIPSKIKNEQERNQINSLINKVKNSIDQARGMLRNKAGQIDNM